MSTFGERAALLSSNPTNKEDIIPQLFKKAAFSVCSKDLIIP